MPLLTLLALVAVLLAWTAGRWAGRELAIDACLDGGGCWDQSRDRCSAGQAGCR